MLEKYIEEKVVNYAKSLGFLAYKFSSPSRKGVPDRIFIKNNSIFWIEFKRKGAKPTELQSKTIHEMRKQGCKIYIIDDIKLGIQVLDHHDTL